MPSGDAVSEIKDRLDIVEVISGYVRLKRQGRNYSGLCPFHAEKSPSFTVSGEKQVWYCFGCNEGGDLFKFVEKAEGLDFPQALELLAGRAGVELEKFGSGRRRGKDRSSALAANKLAAQFFHHVLLNMGIGATALNYLRRRGVEDETIEQFQLGYAPSARYATNLLRWLGKKGISTEEAVRAGLALGGDGRQPIDKFRGRLMIPIFDEAGQIVGFGGRALGNEPPKYMNSPQTVIYDKSRTIYGLSHAKKAIIEAGRALLVEGYFDVLMAHQQGIRTAIASSGTAITEEQVRTIRRLAGELYLCLDSDEAGRHATEKAVDMASRAGLKVRVVELPNAKDPGDFFQKSPQLWGDAEGASQAGWEWWLNGALKAFNLRLPDGRARASTAAVAVLSKIPEEATLDIYCQFVGERLRLDPARLLADVQSFRQSGGRSERLAADGGHPFPGPAAANGHDATERPPGRPVAAVARPDEDELLTLLIFQPGAFDALDRLTGSDPPGDDSFRDLCRRIRDLLGGDPGGSLERHLEAFPQEEQARLARLSLSSVDPLDEEGLTAALRESVDRVKLRDFEAAMAAVEERLKDAGFSDDAQAQRALLEEHKDLARKRAALRGQLFKGRA